MTTMKTPIPASLQQRLWCAPASSDAFSRRFIVPKALRISGPIDAEALQAALNDVVARHEALRTTLVRDADQPYQQVHPPLPVPLTIRDLPAGQPRQQVAEELLIEAETSSIEVEQLPLLRANLARFDNQDAVLSLVAHHSAVDAWSMDLVTRDLAVCYAARVDKRSPVLPYVPQYRDYVQWQLRTVAEPAAAANLAYWQRQLDGAQMFALPTDRPTPTVYTAEYLRHPFAIDSDVAQAVSRIIKAEHFSGFMVLLAALNVLAHQIDGTLDPAISTMFHGRTQPSFRDTVGVFLNFPTMRTSLGNCRSFRDVLRRTRATCMRAYEHEVLHQQILDTVPALAQPLADPANAYFVFGFSDTLLAGATEAEYRLGDNIFIAGTQTRTGQTLPGGVAWMLGQAPSGELGGGVQYSPEVLDEDTVTDWVAAYCRILAEAMADPERDWRQLR